MFGRFTTPILIKLVMCQCISMLTITKPLICLAIHYLKLAVKKPGVHVMMKTENGELAFAFLSIFYNNYAFDAN